MTPDQWRFDETRVWLERARRDLRAARLLIDGQAYGEGLFHCQQALEKALKGFLTFHSRHFGQTHVLGQLGEDCLALDPTLEPALAGADELTAYGWRFRYPAGNWPADGAEAAGALRKAEEAVRAIEERLETASACSRSR
jgi:HEPN domain-containing protein